MDPKLQQKIERDSQAIQIRAGLENLKRLPFINDEMRTQLNEELPKLMPVIKDFVKKKIYELSEKLSIGETRKIYMLKNSSKGPTFYIWKNNRSFDADLEMSVPLQSILDKIEACTSVEEMLAEIISFKIFEKE